MRKIISSTYVSLDGVTDRPQDWSLEYFNEEAMKFACDQLFASDALLMGRHTYEGQAAAWPSRGGDPFCDRINAMTKYVASSTLQNPSWNNTHVLQGDLCDQVEALKAEPGQDILIYGFGPVSHALLERGLLDEIRIWLHPVIVGKGDPNARFFRAARQNALELVHSQTLRTGVVISSYRPLAKAA